MNHWIHRYLDNGEDKLKSKGHPGNTFAAIHKSKNLTEIEKLKLTVAKQEVEIERLKKDTKRKELV